MIRVRGWTAEKLIEKLSVVEENILEEAAEQPELFIEAARYRVDKMRRRVQAQAALEAFDAMRALSIRERHEGERLPLDYFKQRLANNPRHRALREVVERAEEREEFSKLILEAFRMRRDGIKIIAEHTFYEGARETAEIERGMLNKRLSVEARRLVHRQKRLK